MKVREVPDAGNISKMAVKPRGNQDMRFSLIAKTPKIRMSTRRFLRSTYDILETTGSVPWHTEVHWTLKQRFGTICIPPSPWITDFNVVALVQKSSFELEKSHFPKIRSELANEWEVVPRDGY